MKKYIIIPFAFILQISFSQNTFPTNGNAGIGILDPISKLTIIGSLTVNGGLNNASSRPPISSGTLVNGEIRGYSNGWNSADDGFLRLSAGGGTNPIKTYIDLSAFSTVPDMMGNIVFGTYGYERMRIDSNGNIGIGTASPKARLQVNNGDNSYGTILATSSESEFSLYAKSLYTQPAYSEAFRLGLKHNNTEENGFISFYRGSSTSGGFLGFSTNGLERLKIDVNGNVGIGTNNPKNKLDVNGTIHSKEVKVDMTGWSDFVFKKEYNLPTLEEVEKHIAEKGHLENIPSEEEVLKNGISLGEMNAKLLQKIEELTLYAIDQEKKIAVQEKEISALKDLVLRVEKIESKLIQK
jgi:hypothetical protein